jgi:hypothetical protein
MVRVEPVFYIRGTARFDGLFNTVKAPEMNAFSINGDCGPPAAILGMPPDPDESA